MKTNRVIATSGRLVVVAALLALAGCASTTPAPLVERSAASAPSTAASRDTYVVKQGDTVYSIAREHKMDFRELIALNGIDSPNRIAPGKVLKVKPRAEADSGVVSTAPIATDVVEVRPLDGKPVAVDPVPSANDDKLKREPKAGKEAYSDQALALAQNPNPAKAPELGAPAGVDAKQEAKSDTKPADATVTGDEIAWTWPASGKIVGNFGEDGNKDKGEVGNKGIDIAGRAGDPVMAAADGKVILVINGYRGYGKLLIINHNKTYYSVYAHNQAILVKEKQMVTKGQKVAEMGDTDADQVMLHFEIRRQGQSKTLDPLKYLPQR